MASKNNILDTPSTLQIKPSSIGISASGLGKRFNREWIFKDLSIELASGNTFAITGPNGSGKSTLLQVLWGQVPPTMGILAYHNADDQIPIEEISRHISIATPYMDLIDEFTLKEQLIFHFQLRKIRNQLTIDQLLDILYLKHAQHKYIGNFSSGMKQRVKLALAFYTTADVIFLDEPSTNLDKQAFAWYMAELAKLPAGCLIFIASNNAEEYPSTAQIINLVDYKV
jgi:ABC-type multidrug transport system ATPase subunit